MSKLKNPVLSPSEELKNDKPKSPSSMPKQNLIVEEVIDDRGSNLSSESNRDLEL